MWGNLLFSSFMASVSAVARCDGEVRCTKGQAQARVILPNPPHVTGADVQAILTTAHLLAMRRNTKMIGADDMTMAFADVRPSVPPSERRR